ncbi:FXYD domain-containing ion transport regulator 11 [Channa argus]|uniref:FXYD domain-containing ion transport regulator 11 n=1 Tax=Channa argus TaxID=215402 RepID=UPI00351FE79A
MHTVRLQPSHIHTGHVHISLHPKQRGGADVTYSGKTENSVFQTDRLSSAPGPVSSVMLKMGHFTLVVILAVLFTLFMEAEANPFVYNYERLRIGGLVCTGLLVAGGLTVLLYKQCPKRSKKADDDNSTI